MLDQWMEELAKEMGLPASIPREPSGYYTLPVNDTVFVEIREIPGGVSLFCSVSPCPDQRKEEFFTEALLANLFGQATRGAVLGLTDDYSRVTLSLERDTIQNFREFYNLVEDFFNCVDYWVEEVAQKSAAA